MWLLCVSKNAFNHNTGILDLHESYFFQFVVPFIIDLRAYLAV